MSKHFDEQMADAKKYEKAMAQWFRKNGFTIFPACDYLPENKGPRVLSSNRSTVSPDLLVWKGKDALWMEIKSKSSFTWHRRTGCWQTGIDWKYYVEYKSVHKDSPWPVHLVFLQLGKPRHDDRGRLQPSGLYYNSLDVLGEPGIGRTYNPGQRGGMIYWKIDHLIKLAELHEVLQD